MSPANDGVKRKRDATGTRAAILASAIETFALHGYDGAGVREIAQGAGVTAMLVNRYFGSKDRLFAEAVDAAFAPSTIVDDSPGSLSARMSGELVRRTARDADALSPFLIMLRSASSPHAVEVVREGIERHVGVRLAERLEGTDVPLRSELVLALIAGTWLMRRVIATEALAEVDPDRLREQLASLFDVLVEP
jgi:AcrR family transcriptional regulator